MPYDEDYCEFLEAILLDFYLTLYALLYYIRISFLKLVTILLQVNIIYDIWQIA